MRLAESHGVAARRVPASITRAGSSTRTGCCASRSSAAKGWKDFVADGKDQIHELREQIHTLASETGLEIQEFRRIVADGAEGRARGAPGQEGDDRGEPAPRDLDRQEIHQPRPAVPRPDPGRQHRPDEGGRQVRVPPRLQVLDLRHLVDPPGDHPLDRRPGAHHPHPGAHDRDDQQDRAHLAPDAARDRPRADARRSWPRSSPCRSRRCARS